jgi:diguanylate cyclase (GGDEF)-like protein
MVRSASARTEDEATTVAVESLAVQLSLDRPAWDAQTPIRILVADDNAVSRRPIEIMLAKWGYEVTSAASGTEAWNILNGEDPPRIAILDWMMPGLSGPEVCQLVRRQMRHYYTYIIMLTSRYEREDFIAGMESGADDYLVKPPNHRELRVRLGPARRILALEAELAKIREDLRIRATKDALTGLWNRSMIFEILGREISRCAREGQPLGLLVGDLDHFKTVNDTFGHLAGDAVLAEAATRMVESVRPYDSVGRYGGEEFLVILPGCDLAQAERKAETIRAALSRPMITKGREQIVTMSFGAASVASNVSTNAEQLIQLADAALYQAKDLGRNRTVAAHWPA